VTSTVDYVEQNVIPTNKPGAEPKRPGKPVNITALCHLSASVVNNIVVSWNVEEDQVSAEFLYRICLLFWCNILFMVLVYVDITYIFVKLFWMMFYMILALWQFTVF